MCISLSIFVPSRLIIAQTANLQVPVTLCGLYKMGQKSAGKCTKAYCIKLSVELYLCGKSAAFGCGA